MINLTRPKYVIPVVGEYRHQYNLVNLAKSIDIKDENIIIIEQGNMIGFNNGEYIGVTQTIPSGDILLDGKGLGDVNDAVLRDREMLAENGVLMIVSNINAKTRKVLSGPKYVSKGFYFDDEDEKNMTEIFNKIKEKMFAGRFINWVEFKNELKTEINKYVYKKTKTNPIIIPVIISTELNND